MTDTTTFVNYLGLEFDNAPGREIPVRPFVAKKNGNTWYSVSKRGQNPTPYGVKVTPLASALPTLAMIHGHTLALEPGVTQSGSPRVRGSERVLIDGEEFLATVQVSLTKDGNWNLIAKAHRPGGGGGAKATDVDDL